MTTKGSSTLAMIRLMVSSTYKRITDWFKQNPNTDFVYWGKDEFLSNHASAEERKSFLDRHPEIEDLDDHTTVYLEGNTVVLRDFCPRLKEGMKEIYESTDGRVLYTDNYYFYVEPEGENFTLKVWPK